MKQEEMLQLILEKLVSLEQGQRSLEQGQRSLVQGQRALEERQKALEERQKVLEEGLDGLRNEILTNRQAIMEMQTDVQDIKQAMRYYDYKLVEHEKQIFKLQS